jgi:hypothetical protein
MKSKKVVEIAVGKGKGHPIPAYNVWKAAENSGSHEEFVASIGNLGYTIIPPDQTPIVGDVVIGEMGPTEEIGVVQQGGKIAWSAVGACDQLGIMTGRCGGDSDGLFQTVAEFSAFARESGDGVWIVRP